MSGTGLAVTDVVSVGVSFSPIGAQYANFGALMIAGPSNVINAAERYRTYSSYSGVTGDFSITTPEAKAANAFFAQAPQPSFLTIGRWLQSASNGVLTSGVFAPATQAAFITTMQGITTGGMNITLGGTLKVLSAQNFSAVTSMVQIAAVMNTALSPATCVWDSNNNVFRISTSGTGVTLGAITYASPATGTDLSAPLKLTAATSAQLAQGAASETPAACLNALATINNNWYGFIFAPTNVGDITNSDYLACAAIIESLSPSRIFGVNIQDSLALSPGSTTDLAYLLSTGSYTRTCSQYCSTNQYAIASLFGRAFTVNFAGSNTALTLKFQQEPTVTAEIISETQWQALKAKNCNVFVKYNNNTSIIQEGVMVNGYFFDEVQGTDWLANNIQVNVFNKLYTAGTKIPQTDPGAHELVNAVEASCDQGVTNGLLAPGVWNGPPIGPIVQGQFLPAGYYVYCPPIASQSQADRAARKAPFMQVLVKMAGAVHSSNLLINVNR